jgi:dienelactone hydrolase
LRSLTHALLAAAICLLADPALAERRESLVVVSPSRANAPKIKVELLLPDDAPGKIPVMIIMHGSGGVSDRREFAYAREFLKLGVGGAIVDSFGSRGIASTVRDQGQLASVEMMADVVDTLRVLAKHPAIDPSRIGIIGYSKGGTVVIKAALRRYLEPVAKGEVRFSLLIAVYPWCNEFPLDMTGTGTTLHMLNGADDTYVSIPGCVEYAKRMQDAGAKVVVKTYKGKHGWDTPGNADWTDKQGENHSQCFYDETGKGTWVERSSKITVVDNNKRTAEAAKATAKCMTRTVSGGYSREAHAQSLDDIRGFIREAFRLR